MSSALQDGQPAVIDPTELKLHRFHGGLRLRHNKWVSCAQPVTHPALPKRLDVPLQQHRGEPAHCLVNIGERVLKGQLIGRGSQLGAGIHAPASGTVVDIADGPITQPGNIMGTRISIEPDGEEQWQLMPAYPQWGQMPPEALRERIHAAGIVGLGGAVFPTGLKLDGAVKHPIDMVLLNGAECEPWISCDEMLMRNRPEAVIAGARILRRAIGAKQCLIAIEDQMGAVFEALGQAIADSQSARISIIKVPKLYPEGGERQLIEVITGKQVPAGGFPHDLGIVCQNVATAAAVSAAVLEGKALVERYVTVTGTGIPTPRNLLTLIGTPIAHLVEACGGYTEQADRLLVGGPMMGVSLPDDSGPVVKATNCVLVLEHDDIRQQVEEMPCIRCGECSAACPASLMPQDLHLLLRAAELDQAEELGLLACIECGCCDLVCPSHIPLTDWFRYGKSEQRRQQAERAFSERSKERFEARKQRLERVQQERAERMAKRKQKLASEAQRKRQIAAALERVNAGKDSAARAGSAEQSSDTASGKPDPGQGKKAPVDKS